MTGYMLARSACYDESISLARTVGEVANMVFLFANVPAKFDEWKTLADNQRRKEFAPVKVRLALENAQQPVPVNQQRYGQLCEKGTHPSPHIPPGMYNHDKRPYTGGYFQPAGLCFCLHEVAWPLQIIGICTPILFASLGDSRFRRIIGAAETLGAALPNLRLRVNAEFPSTFSDAARGDTERG
jgi:hypothetical protein